VAITGFAASITAHRRRLTGMAGSRPTPAGPGPRWRRAAQYGNQAVLPFYLLHEPVIVAAAWVIVRWHAPAMVKYAALAAVSFTTTLARHLRTGSPPMPPHPAPVRHETPASPNS